MLLPLIMWTLAACVVLNCFKRQQAGFVRILQVSAPPIPHYTKLSLAWIVYESFCLCEQMTLTAWWSLRQVELNSNLFNITIYKTCQKKTARKTILRFWLIPFAYTTHIQCDWLTDWLSGRVHVLAKRKRHSVLVWHTGIHSNTTHTHTNALVTRRIGDKTGLNCHIIWMNGAKSLNTSHWILICGDDGDRYFFDEWTFFSRSSFHQMILNDCFTVTWSV